MEDIRVDEKIDITKEICPMTFVKTKLKLESMRSGQVLEVSLNDGEPLRNVPRSIKEDGHKILDIRKEGTSYKLLIERR
ncbi:MAG TPA: sulfurtransferase TusA family protein [Thermodesulfobacteriota bacterium]|jgi:tRNA 2-thiouridine synthesizing protein A|nr:sulfurtransferase TusA family protein [Thermodesulfobacteriota bacterium]